MDSSTWQTQDMVPTNGPQSSYREIWSPWASETDINRQALKWYPTGRDETIRELSCHNFLKKWSLRTTCSLRWAVFNVQELIHAKAIRMANTRDVVHSIKTWHMANTRDDHEINHFSRFLVKYLRGTKPAAEASDRPLTRQKTGYVQNDPHRWVRSDELDSQRVTHGTRSSGVTNAPHWHTGLSALAQGMTTDGPYRRRSANSHKNGANDHHGTTGWPICHSAVKVVLMGCLPA